LNIVKKILNNMWESKIHVKGTLPKKDSQFALFIGRWQPLHDGHKALFQQVINEGDKVCIAIRNVEPDEKNPYTAKEVYDNICEFYQNNITLGQVKVIIIPDICSVEFGRGVGYDIIERIPPQEIADISATKIREAMKNNQDGSTK
jgi:cytidyltransferase-like protein